MKKTRNIISPKTAAPVKPLRRKRVYRMPSTELLNETPTRGGYDGQELKEVAGRIKSKLEEFNVRGIGRSDQPRPRGHDLRIQA